MVAAGAEPVTSAPDRGRSIIVSNDLEKAFNWAAAGFTAVSAILVFFGIKEGVLDQALRLNAASTLCIFVLLGVGVLCALFAPAVDQTSRMRFWPIPLAVLMMLAATRFYLPDLDDVRAREEAFFGVEQEGFLTSATRIPLWLLLLLGMVGAVLVGAHALDRRAHARDAQREHRRGGVASAKGATAWMLHTGHVVRHHWGLRMTASLLLIGVGVALAILLLRDDQPRSNVPTVAAETPSVVTTVLALSLAVGLMLLTAWAFWKEVLLPTMAGLVLLAVTATAIGLYGATKVALQSKMLAVVPQVTATMVDGDAGSRLTIHAEAGRMRGYGLVVWAEGSPRDPAGRPQQEGVTEETAEQQEVALWSAVLRPDAVDDIDRTWEVPLTPQRWEQLGVKWCLTRDLSAEGRCIKGTTEQTAVIRNRASEVGIGQVSADIGLRHGDLVARFAASDIAPGVSIRLAICRTAHGRHAGRLAMVTLAPGADDSVTWRTVIPEELPADRWTLRMRSYPPGPPSGQRWTRVATYEP